MKINLTFLLLLCCVAGCSQDIPVAQQTQIDSVFKAYTQPGSPGVAVLIIKDGNVVFKKGYGLASLEYNIQVSTTTVFDIASVSKQFTGFAISTLIQQGKISPDDDIHKYLPDVPQFNKPMTIRNLIHHTSGLRDWPAGLHAAGWRWDEAFSYDDIMRMVSKQRDLDFEPGSQYSYSNTGYNLLAAIVAKVSSKTFPDWIAENIFKPLGMNSSQVLSDYSNVVKNLAGSYSPSGRGYSKNNDELTAWGSSSIVTTAEDLSKWMINFQRSLDKRDPVYLRMIETDLLNNGQKNNYAYGLAVGDNNGIRNIQHDGGWAGFRTIISNYPDEKLSIILLSNHGNFDSGANADAIAQLFLKHKLKAGPARPDINSLPTIKVDSSILKKYTGTYQLGTGWYATFTLEDGKLMVQANGENKFSTDLKTDTSLWVPAYGASVTFTGITDKAGALKYKDINAKRIVPIKADLSQLNEYAGSYYSPELEASYRLTVENGKLVAHHMRLGDFAFDPDIAIAGGFSSYNGNIAFYKNGQNKVSGFKLTNGRIKNIVFNKQ
ncbi:serine hydrolase [Mucilaginibacter sp.]|uniref:serine hydrolase domain-containing protein n=1 Tax=Mucilaginibacter sp. TaxID=1882438 RepID=UPI002609C210|nr:serine hydrolase domain-containing protein [Mucilaginibacter sp.]MDB4922274.1 beta-lactamase [Mucilaginibacter sp.]